jgi:hypothetical protein
MIFLLALRGKTAHGGGYGSRSPPVTVVILAASTVSWLCHPLYYERRGIESILRLIG